MGGSVREVSLWGLSAVWVLAQLVLGSNPHDQVVLSDHYQPAFEEASCSKACELLATVRSGQVQFPGTPEYEKARYGFWDKAQATTVQECIFQPTSAADVSLALIITQQALCRFAIKSGGHGRSGESSVEGGLGIDLVKLDQINVSEDFKVVTVGPGLRWVDVYTALEPLGITVIGGRDYDVGVGGFLLGGGISFLSNKYGWATENIQSFEIVLANGTITTASATHNEDLYKVLRGGGANFGIVTAFNLEAVPYEGMWGGIRASMFSEIDGVLDAFHEYATVSTIVDPYVSVILNTGIYEGSWVFGNDLEYGKKPDAVPPPIMKAFMDIPAPIDETGIRDMSDITISMGHLSPRGNYNSYWVLILKHDRELLRFYLDQFVAASDELIASNEVDGFSPNGCIQTISPNMRRIAREKNGGNIIGTMGESDEPLLLLMPAVRYNNPKDASKVYKLVQDVLAATKKKAQELGKDHEMLYMNYASHFQAPLPSYGKDSLRLLQAASQKYDPKGVFQTLRGSGFKLSGAYNTSAI